MSKPNSGVTKHNPTNALYELVQTLVEAAEVLLLQ